MIDPPGPSRTYIIAMVGLPARGKSYTARKLRGYLDWLGYPARTFNVGQYRRRRFGPRQSAKFFDPTNEAAVARRETLFDEVLADAVEWLRADGRIAILDATNSTASRRARLRAACDEQGIKLLFIELYDDDLSVVEENIRAGKIATPDYRGMDPDRALDDFRARVANYASAYEPLAENEGSWIRIENRGRQVIVHEAPGWIIGRITSLLTNLAVGERPILLTRHGQSAYNLEDRLGGDSPLTDNGRTYARRLAAHVHQRLASSPGFRVWTSTLQRTIETAEALGVEPTRWRSLDEIQAGVCDGRTYAEVERKWPEEFAARKQDKLRYRYPGGESYEDVIKRVDRVILELESVPVPVVVISHRAVLRTLYAYFHQLPIARAPHVEAPLHTVIELTPGAYGCAERLVPLGPDAGELP